MGVRETFIDTLLTDPDQFARRRFERVDRRVLFDRLVRGGYPELPGDVKHLQGLRDKLGGSFTAGVVLYLGDRVVPLGERIWALPVSMLWAD